MLHLWHTYLHVVGFFMVNVGKYTIHVSYGVENPDLLSSSPFQRLVLIVTGDGLDCCQSIHLNFAALGFAQTSTHLKH